MGRNEGSPGQARHVVSQSCSRMKGDLVWRGSLARASVSLPQSPAPSLGQVSLCGPGWQPDPPGSLLSSGGALQCDVEAGATLEFPPAQLSHQPHCCVFCSLSRESPY